MRKITMIQTCIFLVLFLLSLVCGVVSTAILFGDLELGDFRGVVLALIGLIMVYMFALMVFRCFLWWMPLYEGEIPRGSKQEFVYHIYLLFFLLMFYPVIRSGAVPVPLMRLFYLALGAKLGNNTYSSGIILDPGFVEIGDNTLIGQYALIVPHAIENEHLAHYRIRLGNNVTIGAHAVVLAGVTIEDNALVATGAIVPKGTYIAAGEVWGGVPAKRIRGAKELKSSAINFK